MCTIGPRAVLAVLVLSGTQACLAQAPRRAERPDVRAGEAAEYRDLTVRTGKKRDTTFVVTTVDADKIVSEMSGSTSGTRTYAPESDRIAKRDYAQASSSRNFLDHHVIELLSFKATP
jgi:hypothetical protein